MGGGARPGWAERCNRLLVGSVLVVFLMVPLPAEMWAKSSFDLV